MILRKGLMDNSLIQRIQAGDKDAFSKVYHDHYSKMCDFAFTIIRLEEESEEIVQDVFLNIWKMHTTWEPKGSIRSYLYKATKNKALDFLKHKKVVRDWEHVIRDYFYNDTQSPEDDFCHTELARIIEISINKLPEKRKMIFLLSREHGLSYNEIANVLDVSIKTIETQMGRSLKALRQVLVGYLSK